MGRPSDASGPGADQVGRLVEQALREPGAHLARRVQPASVVDEVADRLLTVVALGEFVPGERLPAERTLAQLLGVGRSTVHEAMGRLRAAGIVEVRRGRAGGSFVRSDWSVNSADAVTRTIGASSPRLEQLLDLRGLVEAMVARTAAERRSHADVVALRAALAAFARARTPEEEHAADSGIHRAVTGATRNPLVASLTQGLLATITVGIPIEPYSRNVFNRALAEHTDLVEAVVAGDVDRAGAVAQAHFAMTARTVRGVLRRGRGAASDDAVSGRDP